LLSPEELAVHDNRVVCPQCLSVFQVDADELAALQAQQRRQAALGANASGYCYNCGKALPEGFNFCPYCGVDLNAPFVNAGRESSEDASATDAASDGVTDKPGDDGASRRAIAARRSDVLRGMQMTNHVITREALHTRAPRASRRFKAFAYTIILLLIALFVVIVVAGNNIQPS